MFLIQAKDQGHDDDAELLRCAGQGDEPAVRRLFRKHAPRLHRHVSRVLGASDPDVDDVVQQIFLAALDGADRFDGRSTVSTWLFGIATRRALDAARARWRRQRFRRLGDLIGDQLGAQIGFGGSASRPDRMYDASAAAEEALGRLTPDQRTVFLLHDVEGYTFAEISEVTGLGISTLHGRLQVSRKQIERLSGDEP
jgi:RNA polymerase sigma-70 factor (ECF subfamily)